MKQEPHSRRSFGPLVKECADRGISRTVAFSLARERIIETFHIGRSVYVKLDSLDRLPETLAKRERAA